MSVVQKSTEKALELPPRLVNMLGRKVRIVTTCNRQCEGSLHAVDDENTLLLRNVDMCVLDQEGVPTEQKYRLPQLLVPSTSTRSVHMRRQESQTEEVAVPSPSPADCDNTTN
ncbi:MAG: hypothetical protein MHM6MM_006009 [Cercozoa sp. M6MM]